MDRARHFRTLFAWDGWANQQAFRSLQRGDEALAPAVRLLAHIIAAKRLWLGRIQGDPAPVVVWPDLGLDECGSALDAVEARWARYLDALGPAELARDVAYVNSKGESWTSAVEQILTHVPLHSHYHRGQIAARVRAAGREPAYTDFIHAVRTNALTTGEVSRG
ncbi:MAG TPA: DinB family protein [Gemmatimonadales bacterium]|nr:DinB family protein [Gemmatimonadales bacterium]